MVASAQESSFLNVGLTHSPFFSTHLKSLFFVPFWVCWISLASRDRILRAFNLVLLAVSVRDTYAFSKLRTSCEEHLLFQNSQAAGGFVRPAELFSKPIEALSKLVSNLIGYPVYFENALFDSESGNSWFHTIHSEDLYTKFTAVNLFNLFILYGVIIAFLYAFMGARLKRVPLGRKRELLVSISLFVALGGIAAFNTFRPFYDSWITILTLFLAISLLGPYCQLEALRKSLKILFSISRFATVASLAIFVSSFASEFRNLYGVESKIQQVLYLTPLGNDAKDRALILQIAPRCRISLEASNISVDEDVFVKIGSSLKSPYMAFFYMPQFIPDGLSVATVMDRARSTGMIARCSSLYFNENLITEGSYCCLPSTSVMRKELRYQKWILPGPHRSREM